MDDRYAIKLLNHYFWIHENPEKMRKNASNFRKRHPSRHSEYNKRYYEKYPEKRKAKLATSRDWISKNKTAHLKTQRAWYIKNKEHVKAKAREWYKHNKLRKEAARKYNEYGEYGFEQYLVWKIMRYKANKGDFNEQSFKNYIAECKEFEKYFVGYVKRRKNRQGNGTKS